MNRTARTWLLASIAAASCACRSIGANAHNLDQLHSPDGRVQRVGNLVGPLGFELRRSLGGLVPGLAVGDDDETRSIKDPLGRCVENLAEMSEFDGADPYYGSLQSLYFSWLAVDDPWHVSRELCVRGLGAAGERLGLAGEPPPDRRGEPVVPIDLRGPIEELTAAAADLRGGTRAERAAAAQRFEAACDAIEELPIDRRAGLRALRVAITFERALGESSRVYPRLRRLNVHLQKICVREALLAALRDRAPAESTGTHPGWDSPLVRSAAIEACVQAFGPRALADFLVQIQGEDDPDTLLGLLRAVRERGLPRELEGLSESDLAELRELWTRSILAKATNHPSSRVRVAAMRALRTISGGELGTLREEEWAAWYTARTAGADTP